jgi:hypothetical protein
MKAAPLGVEIISVSSFFDKYSDLNAPCAAQFATALGNAANVVIGAAISADTILHEGIDRYLSTGLLGLGLNEERVLDRCLQA